jgi:hypothetical protein
LKGVDKAKQDQAGDALGVALGHDRCHHRPVAFADQNHALVTGDMANKVEDGRRIGH